MRTFVPVITARARLALAAGSAARWASRTTGRGAGAMIGGLIAMKIDPTVLAELGRVSNLVGQSVTLEDWTFTVLQADQRSLQQLRACRRAD